MCEASRLFSSNPGSKKRMADGSEKKSPPVLNNLMDITKVDKFDSVGNFREKIRVDKAVIEAYQPVVSLFQELQNSVEATQSYDEDGVAIADNEIESKTESKSENDPKNTTEKKSEKVTPQIVPLDVLDQIGEFVTSQLQHAVETVENNEIAALVNQYNAEQKLGSLSQKESCVPLEYFLKCKKGNCRHVVLLTALLLAKLIQLNESSNEQVYCFTTNIKNKNGGGSRHAMVLYIDGNQHLHLIDYAQNIKPIDITELQTHTIAEQHEEMNAAFSKIDGVDLLQKIQAWQVEKEALLKEEPVLKKARV